MYAFRGHHQKILMYETRWGLQTRPKGPKMFFFFGLDPQWIYILSRGWFYTHTTWEEGTKARDEFERGQDRGEHGRDCGGGAGMVRCWGAVWKPWKGADQASRSSDGERRCRRQGREGRRGSGAPSPDTQPFTLDTPHSTLDTLHTTLDTPHVKFSIPHSTLHSTLYTVHVTLHTPHCALDTLHTTFYTLHFTHYTLHSTLHTLHHFTHYILHSTLSTLHFTLYTPYLTLYSLHSSPTTRHQHPSATFTLQAPLLSLTPTSSPKQRPSTPSLPSNFIICSPSHAPPPQTSAAIGNLCYVGSFASQQRSNKASPQRAHPSHALLHITLYTYTPRPGTPVRTMSFLLPFPFPLIFSNSSITFLMFWLRSCFILPSIPVAPQCTSMDGPGGESKPTVNQLPHGTSTAMATRISWGSASKWSVLRPPPPGPPILTSFAMSNFSQAWQLAFVIK